VNITHPRTLGATVLLLLTALILCGGCASTGPARPSSGPLDTAEHHCLLGNQFMDMNNPEEARKEFLIAEQLDPDHGPAKVGTGRALSRLGKTDEALKSVQSGLDLANSPAQETEARLGLMEVWNSSNDPLFLKRVKQQYESLQDLRPGDARAEFLMAEAYAKAGRHGEAEIHYANVMKSGGPLASRAETAWMKVQDRTRAVAASKVAKEIVDLKEITRAQACALLAETFRLPQIAAMSKTQNPPGPGLDPAEQADSQQASTISLPKDLEEHPLRNDAILTLALELRGLQPLQDGLFHPDSPMFRSDMALVLEDLYILLTGKQDPVSFIGNTSPFSDISPEHYAFNAVTFCISRDVMSADAEGRFEPAQPITGLEAINSLRKIQAMTARPPLDRTDAPGQDAQPSDIPSGLFLKLIKSGLLFLL